MSSEKKRVEVRVNEETKLKMAKRSLVKYKDLPEYLKDNEYILDYYRCEWPLKDTLLSVFSWHNETLNIWTHLGGFFIFLGLTVMSCYCMDINDLRGLFTSFFSVQVNKNISNSSLLDHTFQDSHMRNESDSSALDLQKENVGQLIPRWPWFVFLAGAMGCLVCSSISHLFACHSKNFSLFFWRLDYAGISLMIVCSFFAPIYYAFFCHPYSRLFYLASITVLGILAIIALLAPALSSPRFRSFRASLFLAMGVYGIVPAAHGVALNWNDQQVFVSLGYEVAMGILYAIGVGFYVSRIPERWKPGAFDIAGHSHQIFHVFVVAAALVHCVATLSILDYRQKSPTCVA